MDLFGELEWRGLVYDATEGLRELVARERPTAYIGFDPTSSSLHVGSLLPILALARLLQFGHDAIALIGGGTGLIGDPSGKSSERRLLDDEQVRKHSLGVLGQLKAILSSARKETIRVGSPTSRVAPRLHFVNNATWLQELTAITFMRDIGKHFSVNSMLKKDSVKRRLENEEGISYTEFSYSLLQAYDFLELNRLHRCTLQLGGSDQWGNITAGTELIRRLRNETAHGLVMPLITTASGTKFGKTEAGAVWLDANRTSPFEFYQFWLNTEDRDAVKYLKFFTFLGREEITTLETVSAQEPSKRHAQRALATEVTRIVHGARAAKEAEGASAKLFGNVVSAMTASDLLSIFSNVPSLEVSRQPDGWRLTVLLVETGLAKSMSDAVRLIRGRGIYVNDQRITDEKTRLQPEDAIEGRVFVLRKGAKQNHIVKISAG